MILPIQTSVALSVCKSLTYLLTYLLKTHIRRPVVVSYHVQSTETLVTIVAV